MNEQKNVIFAFVLSFLILIGFNVLYQPKEQPKVNEIPHVETNQEIPEKKQDFLSFKQAFDATKRVPIDSPKIKGSIALKGAKIDNIVLSNYKENTQKDSPTLQLLTPDGTKNAYFIYSDFQGDSTPTNTSFWEIEGNNKTLSPLTPVTLKWINKEGVVFKKVFSIDEHYMIKIEESVVNTSNHPLNLQSRIFIKREGTPQTGDYYILHEGPIGVLGDVLYNKKYSDIAKEHSTSYLSTGGWIGFTDKYWLSALIAENTQAIEGKFSCYNQNYDTSITYAKKELKENETYTLTHRAFIGPKKLDLLKMYAKEQQIEKFDLALDFGWFYFLTKPLFSFLDWLHNVLGSFGLAIIALTVIVKSLMFPLAHKTFKSMQKIKNLHPKINQLKQLYGDDKVRMNQELMKLYQKEKANPMSGCLPVLIQAPIFFCLYKVFFISVEMRHAPFLGWIYDLSEPDPTSLFNLFGLLPWNTPSFLTLGLWPIFMGITMFVQQKFNPQSANMDPSQAKAMLFMPAIFVFLFASFPAGMVVYWTFSNIITIIQQFIMRRMLK